MARYNSMVPHLLLILATCLLVSTAQAAPLGRRSLLQASNQGVCGSGPAQYFPNRCYFNNDPQGRYVCCDNQGCDGFNPPGNFFPHCKNAGFVPAGYGVGAPAAITVVPAATACPAVNGAPTNSCFNRAGTAHVCCVNPDTCGAFAANGDPTCASGNYYVFA